MYAPKRKQMRVPVKGTKKDYSQDKKIVKIQKQLLGMKPEVKYKDYQSTAALAASNVYAVPLIGQGDDFNQRVGEVITSKNVDLKLYFQHTAGVAVSPLRIMLVWDKQWNAASVFNVFSSLSPTESLLDDTTVTNPYCAPLNDRTSERFAILHDSFAMINPDSSTTAKQYMFRKKFNLSNATIKYADSGLTSASLTSRCLFLVVLCDSTNTTAVISWRFKYTDA